MAKANLVLPNGTTVNIDGTIEEVATLLEKFSGAHGPAPTPAGAGGKGKAKKKRAQKAGADGAAKKASGRLGPQELIAQLAEQDYFKSKRTLGEVQAKLEEGGHIYAMQSLSTPILRLTRKKILRRLKEKDGWAYVS
jgi:hypothetical protein